MRQSIPSLVLPLAALLLLNSDSWAAQDLESQLTGVSPADLAEEARRFGDPERGAVVFYQRELACTRCHIPD